jgi:hypothetical protein
LAGVAVVFGLVLATQIMLAQMAVVVVLDTSIIIQ